MSRKNLQEQQQRKKEKEDETLKRLLINYVVETAPDDFIEKAIEYHNKRNLLKRIRLFQLIY